MATLLNNKFKVLKQKFHSEHWEGMLLIVSEDNQFCFPMQEGKIAMEWIEDANHD